MDLNDFMDEIKASLYATEDNTTKQSVLQNFVTPTSNPQTSNTPNDRIFLDASDIGEY